MGQISDYLRKGQKHLTWYCEGCEDSHTVTLKQPGDARGWEWNGDAEKPTFGPSVLTTSGHYVSSFTPESDTCWCKAPDREDRWPTCYRCHIFVRDGVVQFLDDCTHSLRGFRPMVPLPEHMRDDNWYDGD